MTAPFAAAQDRLNRAVLKHLANVDVLLAGVPMVGIVSPGFDNPPVSGFGPAGSSPSIELPIDSVPTRPEGLTLVIVGGPSAGNYKVGSAHPDATGMVTLHLNSA